MQDQAAQSWAAVQASLKKTLGLEVWSNWLQPLSVVSYRDGEVTLDAPSSFMRDWVTTHYLESLLSAFREQDRTVQELRITSSSLPLGVGEGSLSSVQPLGGKHTPSVAAQPASQEDELPGSPLDDRFTFDNFVVGKPNELAHAAARRVADSTEATFNPLFLYGSVGLGKTHLMHAIAHHIRTHQPHRKVIYLSAEKFMYQFIRALRFKNTVAFKERFRSVHVLMIDDVQFISGKESTQEEFFHTFNALVDQNRQVIISADKSPSDLEGIQERMRSRLGWGLVADVHPTTYELRLGILQSKSELLKIPVSTKILEFLAHKITSNVRELEGALTRVTAHATLVGRELSISMAQDVLKDLLRASERVIRVDEIQDCVSKHYNLRFSELCSSRRSRAVARPRQIAMFLTKRLTTLSLPEIARKFGKKDHTTVLHAVRTIEKLMVTDRLVQEDIDLLHATLQA